jgi:hypothetical protein
MSARVSVLLAAVVVAASTCSLVVAAPPVDEESAAADPGNAEFNAFEAIGHPDPDTRLMAAERLGRMRGRRVVSALLRAMYDGDQRVQAAAARGLRHRRDKRAIPALAEVLMGQLPQVASTVSNVKDVDVTLNYNPGFEEGVSNDNGYLLGRQQGGGYGWTYQFLGAGKGNVWDESTAYPSGDCPSGKHALRVGAEHGHGYTVVYSTLWQQLDHGAKYRASVHVRAAGKFGADGADRAQLVVQVMNKSWQLYTVHRASPVLKADPKYVEQAIEFEAQKGANAEPLVARLILETHIAEPYPDAWVTYDDCELRKIRQ